jgi:hypothetical protein
LNSTGAEDIVVSEVLSGKITNWEVREDDLSSGFNNFVKFIINYAPFSINDLLEIIWVFNSNFSIIFFSFKLKLVLKNQDFWVLEMLLLLFETSIRESLFETDTMYHEGISDGSTGDFLDTDISLLQILIEIQDGVNDHLGEEGFIIRNNLGVEGGLRTFDE